MNKNKLVNNQYRKQEFEKRRKFGKAESLCQSNGGCPIFQNCLLEIDTLQQKLDNIKFYIEQSDIKNMLWGKEILKIIGGNDDSKRDV